MTYFTIFAIIKKFRLMPLKHRLLLFLLLMIGFGYDANAKHIAGGDFTYRRLNGNNFEITLKIFRD